MLVLVCYDISNDKSGDKRLRKVAEICKDHGQRVQYSVFECIVEPEKWFRMKNKLMDTIDKDLDSLRFYYLGSNWRRKIEYVGVKTTFDQEGPLII